MHYPNDEFNKIWIALGQGLVCYHNTGARPTKERYKLIYKLQFVPLSGSSLICSVVIKSSIESRFLKKQETKEREEFRKAYSDNRAETERDKFHKKLRKELGGNRAQWTQINAPINVKPAGGGAGQGVGI